jgi:hypothetical protein
MVDQAVHNLQVQEQARFDARGNPHKIERYSFFVGNNGPFTCEYPATPEGAALAEQAINAKAAQLRALGALPAHGVAG